MSLGLHCVPETHLIDYRIRLRSRCLHGRQHSGLVSRRAIDAGFDRRQPDYGHLHSTRVVDIALRDFGFLERDFERPISPITEAELTLKDLTSDLDLSSEDPTDEPRNHARPFIQACTRMGQIARLSAREQNIFELLALGRGSENIAKRLSISLNTARTHTHNVYTKLNVHSRQELIELVEDERKRQQDDQDQVNKSS